MSDTPFADALQETVHSVIAQTLSEQGGGLLTGWALTVDFMNSEGEPSWAMSCAPDQNLGTTAGLTATLRVHVDENLRRWLTDD